MNKVTISLMRLVQFVKNIIMSNLEEVLVVALNHDALE